MLLTEIVSSLNLSGQPSISMKEQGLQLFYPNPNDLSQSLPSLLMPWNEPGLVIEYQSVTVPHRSVVQFLLTLGAKELGLRDAIERFYLAEKMGRAKCLAQESIKKSITDQPMSDELLTLNKVALAPRPNLLIADMTITMPSTTQARTPRVVFLLDRSGSMSHFERLEMLKPAVINTIDQLPSNTLVSVYFYDDHVSTVFSNKSVATITQDDRNYITNIQAGNLTKVSVAVQAMIKDLNRAGIMDDAQDFEDLTVVWLTDGDDDAIKTSDELVQLFETNNCHAMPHLITVGVGGYNKKLLNGVAEDVRFKSNLMLHINSPADTGKLFDVVKGCVGVMRKKVTLVMEAEGRMTYQDLGTMQAGQVKRMVMELPIPSRETDQINCRILLNEQAYKRSTILPEDFNYNDTELLITYFKQLKDKIILARHNNPDAAEAMRKAALASIPSRIQDERLQELRRSFMPSHPALSLNRDSTQSTWVQPWQSSGQAFFGSAAVDDDQALYSQALQGMYTQTI